MHNLIEYHLNINSKIILPSKSIKNIGIRIQKAASPKHSPRRIQPPTQKISVFQLCNNHFQSVFQPPNTKSRTITVPQPSWAKLATVIRHPFRPRLEPSPKYFLERPPSNASVPQPMSGQRSEGYLTWGHPLQNPYFFCLPPEKANNSSQRSKV